MKDKIGLLSDRKTQISILLTIIALLLWSHSILYAKLEIGYFGLIHSLPITFFVALAFLTAASAILWLSKENHSRLLCLQLVILVCALWLIPPITGGSPPSIDHAYRNLGYIDYIVSQNHFDPSVAWYLNWPGAFIISAMSLQIGSINLEPIIGYLPLLIQLLYLLPLYVLLKNVLGESRSNYLWVGGWLFYLAQWVRGGYLSTQGIAFFFLLILLALLTTPAIWEKNSRSFALLSMVVVVFAALAVTHLLTTLAALAILIVLCLVKMSKKVAPVVILCVLLLVSWDMTGGAHYLRQTVSQPLVAETRAVPRAEPAGPPRAAPSRPDISTAKSGILIFDPEVITQREVTGHFAGSESHIAVAKIRVLFSGIFVLIGLAGAILLFAVKRNFKMAVPILAITLAPLLLLPLSGHYSAELLHRLYLFALPGMACFGAILLDTRSKIPIIALCVLLIISFPLHVISRHGNQEIDYLPPGHVAGMHFFHDKADAGYVFGSWPLGAIRNIDRYRVDGLAGLEWEGDRPILGKKAVQDLPYFISVSRRDKAWYKWFMGGKAAFFERIERLLNRSVSCSFVYSNPDFSLYICDSEERD